MSTSSILGGERAARRGPGKDVDALGPSDSSDSGSDVQGEHAMSTEGDALDELGSLPTRRDSDSDALGTGERGSATGRDTQDGADIAPDRVENTTDSVDALLDADRLTDDDVESLAADDAESEDEDESTEARP